MYITSEQSVALVMGVVIVRSDYKSVLFQSIKTEPKSKYKIFKTVKQEDL